MGLYLLPPTFMVSSDAWWVAQGLAKFRHQQLFSGVSCLHAGVGLAELRSGQDHKLNSKGYFQGLGIVAWGDNPEILVWGLPWWSSG